MVSYYMTRTQQNKALRILLEGGETNININWRKCYKDSTWIKVWEAPDHEKRGKNFFYIQSNAFKMQVVGSLDALSSLTIYFIFTNDFW